MSKKVEKLIIFYFCFFWEAQTNNTKSIFLKFFEKYFSSLEKHIQTHPLSIKKHLKLFITCIRWHNESKLHLNLVDKRYSKFLKIPTGERHIVVPFIIKNMQYRKWQFFFIQHTHTTLSRKRRGGGGGALLYMSHN